MGAVCDICQISYGLLQFDYFVCPIDYDEVKGGLSMECERSFAFRLHEYGVPWFIHSIGALVRSFCYCRARVRLLFCDCIIPWFIYCIRAVMRLLFCHCIVPCFMYSIGDCSVIWFIFTIEALVRSLVAQQRAPFCHRRASAVEQSA